MLEVLLQFADIYTWPTLELLTYASEIVAHVWQASLKYGVSIAQKFAEMAFINDRPRSVALLTFSVVMRLPAQK